MLKVKMLEAKHEAKNGIKMEFPGFGGGGGRGCTICALTVGPTNTQSVNRT